MFLHISHFSESARSLSTSEFRELRLIKGKRRRERKRGRKRERKRSFWTPLKHKR